MFYDQNKKAIPTTYAGIKMRSVLEVRWAVYFDFLGVDWIYEPAKFKIPKHKSYTPDFFLTKQKLFIEIKPEAFEWDERHYEFVKLYNNSIAVCRGLPGMSEQTYIMIQEGKIVNGKSHFFSKVKDYTVSGDMPLEWFYKVLWTWVKTHPIVAGGENRRVHRFYESEFYTTYNIMVGRGEGPQMVFEVANNQCPKCRRFNSFECNEYKMEPYCTGCGYNR